MISSSSLFLVAGANKGDVIQRGAFEEFVLL